MNDEKKDPQLGSPQEALTTKHINFLDTEDADTSGSTTASGQGDEAESPTKKAWEELRQENREGGSGSE